MSPDVDLFGQPFLERELPAPSDGKRKPTPRKGYAAPPGTGPAGETCRSCEHYARVEHAKVYLKCALVKARWTGGPGTDILARSPACKYWEKPVSNT